MNINFIGIFFVYINLLSCTSYPKTERKTSLKYPSSLVFTGYGKNSYTSGNVENYLNELSLLNANTATFLYSCQTKDLRSSNVDCDSPYTPSLHSMKMAISMAKNRGYSVSVRHYIDVETKDWRCYWNPTDKPKAYLNIESKLISFSKLLEEFNVEHFTIGAEYCKLTTQESNNDWKRIISNIRKNFQGSINYGANWETIEGENEFFETPIWSYVDNIGLDYYLPIPDNIPEEKFYKYQVGQFLNYSKLATQYNKPIFINEIGFAGSSKGISEPYEWRNKTPGSESRQAAAYRETLRALKSYKNVKGIFIWRKLAQNKYNMNIYNPNETGYALWKRKAWYEIKKFFKTF